MKKMKFWLLVTVIFFMFCGSVQAALNVRGTGTITVGGSGDYQLIYDDLLDIIWLDYSHTNDTWDNQMSWVGNLKVSFGGLDLSGWRLPSTGTNPQTGYDQTTSEMGHLYYISLGNIENDPSVELNPFQEMQEEFPYWYGTEDGTDSAWRFRFLDGYQYSHLKSGDGAYGIAVRDGNVVPIPGAVWLLGSGLVSLLGLKWRFGKK